MVLRLPGHLGNLAINVKGYLFYCWFRNACLYKSKEIFSSLSPFFFFLRWQSQWLKDKNSKLIELRMYAVLIKVGCCL